MLVFFLTHFYKLNQSFSKGADFSNLGGEHWGEREIGSGGDFKVCGDELILDIIELQMKKGL